MADHIPFITSEDSVKLVEGLYLDSDIVRIPLDRADRFRPLLPSRMNVWLDPCVDGMDDVDARRSKPKPGRPNSWFDFMSSLPNFEKVGAPAYYARPVATEVDAFVKAIMDRCASHRPAWITVPQLPLVESSDRNKINRMLGVAARRWKSSSGFSGRLILPLVFTHQKQVKGKTERTPKVQQAGRCYHEAQADGFWVVDASLNEEDGSSSLRNKRFSRMIALHEELNDHISSRIRIAGPYWGLNLVLWARGLVDYPAIGVGSGYQYFMAGSPGKQPSAKLAVASLRRRVDVGPRLRGWLDAAIAKLGPSHPVYMELSGIKKQYTALRGQDAARAQVARLYKQWFDIIAAPPRAGRSMALFQDLSAAYVLGKSLPDLSDQGTARRPEAVAEPLMLNCL